MRLPTILSGPIIRRVEPSSINIWIALSCQVEIDAQLFQIDITGTDEEKHYIPLGIHIETKTFKAGEQLFIYLVKISPDHSNFPPCTLLGYDLIFKRGQLVHNLGSYNLLNPDNPRSIVYGDLKYPAFYIDHESEPTNLLYGSCRKPHGQGDDALFAADALVENIHLNSSERPNALFLMGDQIYADDVADPLIPILTELGKELIGDNRNGILQELLPENLNTRLDQVNGRQFLVEHLANFSTRKGDNHLITFGEYAVMYLFSWSPDIWDYIHENDLILSFQQLQEKNKLHLKLDKDEKKRMKELSMLEARYEEQIENVRDFVVSLSAARRLMANTPTYMIFDDHDLTDDWNISEKWTASVRESPLGKYIIGNGLTAYWLFQGWGNEPEGFDQTFLQKVNSYITSTSIDSASYREGLSYLWDFHSWHFIAPTNPKTVFLDTRTQREFDPWPKPVKLGSVIKETTRTPLLISESGWEAITKKLMRSGWRSKTPLNIVSPTPFYGMGLIESFLHKYVFPFKVLGFPVQTTFDFDGWKYNGKGFYAFISQVVSWDPAYCVLLSGDVHFSSSVKSDVQFSEGKKHSFFQFTSSPIHNDSFTGLWGVLMKSVLWLNARKRREQSLYRSCGETYNITLGKSDLNPNEKRLWEERIHYNSFEDGSIAETKNSIGYLKAEKGRLENTLLMTVDYGESVE
ncbi:hypothetical protein DYI25_06735 [Mesobacillus boroniphilus]|uniref:PhoD-like phosphatase metallophosphatase domain-containing protein n=1 Tax=Mesobacillus boroniphilus TaxID=308892 RepID=A0A944GVR1_9BACI|nr:hypothetical protein [Mesobacillus boroniphilus]MBS8264128.1 hypothetical protein [Mesobacillus boroniphilus]